MDILTCPYCNSNNVPEDCHDEDYHDEDVNYECKCCKCDKIFMFRISYIKSYDEFETPCLNDEKHDWVKVYGFPKKDFDNKRRCSYCGKDKFINSEEQI